MNGFNDSGAAARPKMISLWSKEKLRGLRFTLIVLRQRQ
jgi:hypothetical protein